MDGFAHLHVASGFSMRYGASMPEDLVERAAEHGQGALALTDRDGLYGAVRFATACGRAGIAPVLGVDLAVEPLASGAVARVGPRPGCRSPASAAAHPGARRARSSTPGGPRVTVLARGRVAAPPPGSAGPRCAGWSPRPTCAASGACRSPPPTCSPGGPTPTPIPTSCDCARFSQPPGRRNRGQSHGSRRWGDRGGRAGCSCCSAPTPTSAGRCSPGAASGPATSSRRGRRCCPRDGLAVEVVHHGGPEGTPGCRSHAARLLGLADAAGLPAVLTAAVRHADPEQVRTVDLLDAARRLVVLDSRHLDRVTDAGHLAEHRGDAREPRSRSPAATAPAPTGSSR